MMKLIEKYRLELKTQPGLNGDNVVTYVESEFNPQVNKFIENNLEEIKDLFRREGLSFEFLPESKRKTTDVFSDEIRTGEIEPSFICAGSNYLGKSGLYRYEAYHLDLKHTDYNTMMLQLTDIAKAYSRHGSIDYRSFSEDREIIGMLSEMERLARALKVKGVRSEVFEEVLHSLEQPTRLVLDSCGRPTFPNLGNIQIRLNPIEKTLYNFFLNHPEGILADELVGHQAELFSLYRRYSVFDDPSLAEDAIYALCEESKSTLYINISRIKKKFTDKLGERMAQFYIIQKKRDGVYKIELPSDLVSMS